MTLEEAGRQLQLTDGSLSRFEKGTTRVRRPYIKEMINLYGVSNRHEREALLCLNEDAWRKDWWDGDTSDLDMEFIDYTWLESRAETICHFSTLVPGLLQTRAYARAIMLTWRDHDTSQESFERLLDLREQRQRILDSDRKRLSVVLEDTVLSRVVGNKNTLAAQVRHLLDLNDQPSIELRVRKSTQNWAPGLSSPFTLFDMADPYPDVAYVESLVGRTFIEESKKVAQFHHAYDGLYRSALNAKQSIRMMHKALKDLE